MSKQQKTRKKGSKKRVDMACMDARFFRALCDPCRLKMLAYVAEAGEPVTVTQVSTICPTDISVVSRHLACLRDAGILTAEKRGKEVLYSVQFDNFVRTLRQVAEVMECCAASSCCKTT